MQYFLFFVLLNLNTFQFFQTKSSFLVNAYTYSMQRNVTLSNGIQLPLVGLGVGNLDPKSIPDLLHASIQENMQYRIIDTARSSRNEDIVSDSLSDSVSFSSNSSPTLNQIGEIQIVTKVWYTHLGYARTKLSIEESLRDLGEFVKVHMLLHWPRCDDRTEWMHCQEEEDALPDYVKEAGPSPLLNPSGDDAAWKASWKAMEEAYENFDQILSIGVSNFHPDDVRHLVEEYTVAPHIYQGHLSWVFNEPSLFELLKQHNITYQAYNVIQGVFSNIEERPWSRHHLERIAMEVSHPEDILSWPRLLIAFLSQYNIGVVVRTSDEIHLLENSPVNIAPVPHLNDVQSLDMEEIIKTLLQDKDVQKPDEILLQEQAMEGPKPVRAVFTNNLENTPVDLFWVHEVTGEHVKVGIDVEPGTHNELTTFKGHQFVAKAQDGSMFQFNINQDHEDEQFFSIEL